ncbi:hypothetical protein AcV5_009787 [Taiwanofungus camphoratus]|nr:hypothetical protein AcV5_009787 [Antrodia cinnamomea]KAI0926454.1 hypothetical protein AcV7_005389 [Antrodia cinnamomea]
MCSSKHRIRPGLCPKQIMKLRGLETVSGNRLDGGPTQGEQSASRETDSLSSGLPPMQSTPKAHPKGWSLSEEASHEKLKPIPPFTLGQHLGTFSWDEMDGKKGYRIHHLADRRGQQSNALLHQLDYRENSDRMYRLYGHGRYDWGFTPNSDMGILFTVMLTRVVEEQNLSALFHICQRLLAAARQVDISAADLRAQLYAE